MKFCEKCGNLMIAERVGRKLRYVCRVCGHGVTEKRVLSTNIDEMIEEKEPTVPIMERDEDLKQYPKTKVLCPKCENKEAYWFLQQTRGGDEPQTKFFSCTKCGYKWREY